MLKLCYGAREIANVLGLTPRQTYNLVERGGLPHFKSGRTIIARRDALVDWVKTREEAQKGAKGRQDARVDA